MSPGRMMATASAALTTLSRTGMLSPRLSRLTGRAGRRCPAICRGRRRWYDHRARPVRHGPRPRPRHPAPARPGGGDEVVVPGTDVRHRHGHLRHVDLAPAELELALDRLADGLADLTTADQCPWHRLRRAVEGIPGDPAGFVAVGHRTAERAAERQPRASRLTHSRGIGARALTMIGAARRRARGLGLPVEPGPRHPGPPPAGLAAALGEILPGIGRHRAILRGSRPGGSRSRRAAGRNPG